MARPVSLMRLTGPQTRVLDLCLCVCIAGATGCDSKDGGGSKKTQAKADATKADAAKADATKAVAAETSKPDAKGIAAVVEDATVEAGAATTPTSETITADQWRTACDDYAAQCSDTKRLDKCKKVCGDHPKPHTKEMCAFTYCAAKTGKCDNEEEGDTTIMACVRDRGWLPPDR